eukprot:COSAG02_NODE_65103_length_259_cov_0.518750_1_plen_35_part_10
MVFQNCGKSGQGGCSMGRAAAWSEFYVFIDRLMSQ